MTDRRFDVVLFGATGFTGGLTAEYLARNAPSGLRWALAGRNTAKLENVRAQLATVAPSADTLELVTADVTDPDSVRSLAEQTRVVISTVGPYAVHGEPLVAACAAAGTDYVDLTGEPQFVDEMYLRHHDAAVASGARLVHACGFDSIPHDLGAYFTVQQLPTDVPITVRGYVQVSAAFSGGTFASALNAFAHPRSMVSAARRRGRAETRSDSRRARVVPGRPHHEPVTGTWALPLPTIDPQIVVRSARALPSYGPDFRYSHFAGMPHLWTAAAAAAGTVGVASVAGIAPLRRALLARVPAGTGPSADKRARSWFRVTFVAEGGGRRVVTRVSGRDPGYDETAMMLSESALALALDDLPPASGQVTTAAAMGDALLTRVQKAGLTFEVLETS